MRFWPPAAILIASFALSPETVHAAVTGTTGSGMPFDNLQPSLAVNEVLPKLGGFPTRNGSDCCATGDTLGFIYDFAGNFVPGGTWSANGQLVNINSNITVFSLLGTLHGGNGVTTFAMPNLQGTAQVGITPDGSILQSNIATAFGSRTISLDSSQLPAHNHSLTGGGVTGTTGGGVPVGNMQPSLPLHRLIATGGIFPSPGGGGSASFIGQIGTFAGFFVPDGWREANGQMMSIADNDALFAVIGCTYGCSGGQFALPNLTNRVSVGASATHPIGSMFGSDSNTLTLSQMPAHNHTVPGGGMTGTTGGSTPVNNVQPSLALNYIISAYGIFPSAGASATFDFDNPVIGQISEFAGDFAPGGWLLADGSLVSETDYQSLFDVIGCTYGCSGDMFALPDFRDRTMINAGDNDGFSYLVGGVYGEETNVLSVANLPAHDHTLSETFAAPEPASLSVLGLGIAGMLAMRRRARG